MDMDSKAAVVRFPWLVPVLAGIAFVALIGLGTWQVQRLQWKDALIATIAQRMQSPPVALAEIETAYRRTGDVDYWPVAVTGAFLHDRERHFFATHGGRSGFFIYTPLRLADERVVFVNRGFVPYDLKDPAKRRPGQPAGMVTITGLARDPLPGKPSSIVPDNQPDKNIFFWKDRDGMAESAGLARGAQLVPFFIDADAAPNPGGWPVGSVTIVSLPNSHLQYAVTWYGLAAALAAVTGVWLWGRRRSEG